MIVEINDEGKQYVFKIEAPENASKNELDKLIDKSDSTSELLYRLEEKGYKVEAFHDFMSVSF